MAFDIYVILLLFLTGLLFGTLSLLIGIKRPLHLKRIGSYCNKCQEQYEWYQLIPVVSYFFNKGVCPYCHKKLSLWYPILELLSGILFSIAYIMYGFSYELIILCILVFLTINICVSDFKYFVILDIPLIIFSIIVLVLKFVFFGFKVFLLSVSSGALIFIFMLIIRFFGSKFFKQEALGGGDIKLATFFGFVLGLRLSIVSLILGSFLAFPYAIYCSMNKKNREIPFGPFLILGLDVTFIFMVYINNFLSIIFK